MEVFLVSSRYRNLYLWLAFALLLIGCITEPQPQQPSIESDGGGSQFFDGQKEEISGENTSNDQTQNFQIDTSCPGALKSKLQIGDIAEIIIWQLKARVSPGFDTATKHVLAEGRVVKIINGPVCADSGWWWYIHFEGTISTGTYLDFYAWMVEVDYDTYYLKKIQ